MLKCTLWEGLAWSAWPEPLGVTYRSPLDPSWLWDPSIGSETASSGHSMYGVPNANLNCDKIILVRSANGEHVLYSIKGWPLYCTALSPKLSCLWCYVYGAQLLWPDSIERAQWLTSIYIEHAQWEHDLHWACSVVLNTTLSDAATDDCIAHSWNLWWGSLQPLKECT